MFLAFLAAAAFSARPVANPLETARRPEKWCFIVAGDGRSANPGQRTEDKDGINQLITSEIEQAVLDEKAKFLMWTGDLVHGYERDPAAFEKQLLSWRAIMQPLYDRHIPVLPCRGNHDASSTEAYQVWNKVFTGPYALPQNGPEGEKNLTFFYERGPVLAIGLDQYNAGKEMVNQPWLDDVLKHHHKALIFPMGHEAAFMSGYHVDTMETSLAARDVFWNSLIASGTRVFFCGHDHYYDHMIVQRAGADPGPEMHQVLAGTAGAPFYKAGPYNGKDEAWALRRAKHLENTYGYILVEIDDRKATITFKGRTSPGHYESMDSFGIQG